MYPYLSFNLNCYILCQIEKSKATCRLVCILREEEQHVDWSGELAGMYTQ